MSVEATVGYVDVATRRVSARNGIEYAYRDLGASEVPLVLLQHLREASALTVAFVARRLLAEPVGIVFAAREPGPSLHQVSELEVHGVRNGDIGRPQLVAHESSGRLSVGAVSSRPRRQVPPGPGTRRGP